MEINFDKSLLRIRLAKNLQRLRNLAGLSQMDLAELANLSQNFIANLERGKSGASENTLALLANALKTDPEQFYLSDSTLNRSRSETCAQCLNDVMNFFRKLIANHKPPIIFDYIEEIKLRKHNNSS